mgnify:CR=1 FL=1
MTAASAVREHPRRPVLDGSPWSSHATAPQLALAVSAFATRFCFVPLPARFLPILALLVLAYVASAEMAKGWFYRRQAES